jgi:hypothetical protein
MKFPFLVFVFCCAESLGRPAKCQVFIDPTGTYRLKGKVQGGVLTGHSGEIRAKLLNPTRVAISFFIDQGYPQYGTGSFVDTLTYHDNQAEYRPPSDKDCTIIIFFRMKEAEVCQSLLNPRCGCGFAGGVMTSGTFRKSSGDPPLIQDMSAGGIR